MEQVEANELASLTECSSSSVSRSFPSEVTLALSQSFILYVWTNIDHIVCFSTVFALR